MSITPQELADKFNIALNELIEKNKPLEIAARTTHALQTRRIFVRGQNSAGGQIGQYNTTNPLYVNPEKSPGNTAGIKPPTGKNGATEFKTGKKAGQKHKTTWLASYKEYRGRIGKGSDFVNLVLSSDLFKDFASPVYDKDNPRPEMISVNSYQSRLKREDNQKKMEGAEDKYGEITKLTTEEKQVFFGTAEFELKKMFSA